VLARVRAFRAADGYGVWERRADGPMLWLALAFVIVLVVPYATDLPSGANVTFLVANTAIWAAFAVDYGARLYLAPRRAYFARTHVLDLIIVAVPFLRPLRALRLLRLLRLGGVVGVAYRRGASLHARVTTYVATFAGVVLVLAAFAMYDAERRHRGSNIRTLPDALWWAITTMTTVGYGDRYPTTAAGRIIAVVLMLVGIALLGVITAAIATWFVGHLRTVEASEERTEDRLDEVLAQVRRLHERLDRLEGGVEP